MRVCILCALRACYDPAPLCSCLPLPCMCVPLQARMEAQAESFTDRYSVPEAMDAPLLESALPVS